MKTPTTIEGFVAEIVADKEFSGLDEGVLTQIKADLTAEIEKRIGVAIFTRLPEERRDEYQQLLENEDAAKTQAFLSEQIPDLDVLVAAELLNVRSLYLG